MSRIRPIVLSGVALLLLMLPCLGVALDLDDDALDIQATTWFNGESVYPNFSNGKTVYVLLFWATWDKESLRALSLVDALHKKYSENEDIVFVGISQEPSSQIGLLLARMDIGFRIAVDKSAKTTQSYMKGRTGIPKAFIVNTDGTVVWIGNPLVGMGRFLGGLIDGDVVVTAGVDLKLKEEQLKAAMNSGDLDTFHSTIRGLLQQDPYQL